MPSGPAERGHHLDHDGTQQHDEQRGQDAEHQREYHLDRNLHRLLLGPLAALESHLVGLRSQDGRRSQCRRRLPGSQRGESAELRDCSARDKSEVGLAARLTELHVLRVRVSSSANRPSPLFAARILAASKPRPASTAMVIWSRVSETVSTLITVLWKLKPDLGLPFLPFAVQQQVRNEVAHCEHGSGQHELAGREAIAQEHQSKNSCDTGQNKFRQQNSIH